jgi:hypothetical protein|tara:strand:- start:2045 stop:2785 length:741 start_codon:yes stop_codon:yes gene_type:complete
MSIADNHLSEGSLGRFGDDRMYTTKHVRPGSEWHINAEEEGVMNMYGAEGEKLVDAVGSGTIHPYTRKEEKFIDPFTAATFTMGVIGEITGGSAAASGARRSAKATRDSIKDLDKSSRTLDESFGAQNEALSEEYGLDIRRLSGEIGEGLGKVRESTEMAASKTNLAFSGAVSKQKEGMVKSVMGKFDKGFESLTTALSKSKGKLEGWYETKKAENLAERKKLTNLASQYDAQANAPGMHNLFGLL